jgi:hypothetical protein
MVNINSSALSSSAESKRFFGAGGAAMSQPINELTAGANVL